MTSVHGKHWDFYVSEHALIDYVEPILAEHYEDGPLPSDLPGLLFQGPQSNVWRYDRDGGSLAYLRARVVASHLADVLSLLDVFTHDPDTAADPAIDRALVRDALQARFEGSADQKPLTPDWVVSEPHLAPLVAGVTYDDYATPVNPRTVIAALVTAVADAIEAGAIDVDASEPYDSCAGCGGYHNVNYDCA